MNAREIMVQPVATVQKGTKLADVARLLLDEGFGGLPVVDSAGQLCGIVTESDFTAKQRGLPFSTFRHPQVLGQWLAKGGIERIYQAAQTMTVQEIMTSNPVTIDEEDSLEDILQKMLRHKIHRLPVVRDGVPVGIVTRHDLLKAMLGIQRPA